MKFSSSLPEFLNALHLVSRAISGQQAIPILGNVLIEAEGKRCTISATNLELSITTSFEAGIENEGSITVPAKTILNFAQYNTDSEILLETNEGTQLKCTSSHARAVIEGEQASEYPTIAAVEKKESFSIDAEPLISALHAVTFASAKSTLRPVLSGVYLRTEKNQLVFAATDSYRLSEYRVAMNGGRSDISCIIPSKVLDELAGILVSKKVGPADSANEENTEKEAGRGKDHPAGKISIAMSSQQIEISVGSTRLISRLIEGKFPDYQQIIPRESKTKATINAKEFATAVRRMHYFARETNNNLTFSFEKNKLHITTAQTQMGRDEATIDAQAEGESNKIALSSLYLLDFLAHADGESVTVTVTDSMHPAIFRAHSSENYMHLIMPLRLQEE